MAWRIDEQVIHGEIDNRTRGKTTGRIWLVGRDKPVSLDLDGNPWRDLAGHVLRFSNPSPKPGLLGNLADDQCGRVGDITASRKVKVPDLPMEKLMECIHDERPFPWHWSNTLHLEWYSARNGRVVIESTGFTLKLEGVAAWTMGEEDEIAQRCANDEALSAFMGRLTVATSDESDDDAPHSDAEAAADEESARMDKMLDRVLARLEREPGADFETLLDEELERRRRERGEPELTPEELIERQSWTEELNASAEEAIEDAEAEAWKGEKRPRHPLVEQGLELAVRLHREIKAWLPEGASGEHPLAEIVTGVQFAVGKLAGALSHHEEWPPEALFAGDVLVRLKKGREHLRDALSALDSADHENLVTREWRAFVRNEIRAIVEETERLIVEVRRVLSAEDE